MTKSQKWGIGIAVLLVLSFIGSMLPEDKEKKAAEQQASVAEQQVIDTLTELVQLPENAKENGFSREAQISTRSIYITDTAPKNMDIDLEFSQYYAQGTIKAVIESLVQEGINPKDEEINISVRLVTKDKSVTGNEQTRSFGRVRYRFMADDLEWINGAD